MIQGRERSIRQAKKDLMFEVVKRATPILFSDPFFSDSTLDTWPDDLSEIIIQVLPESLAAAGTRYFTIEELSKDKDWLEMACRMMLGVLSRESETFVKKDNKGEVWYLRKSRAGRKRNGEWRFCEWCAAPFYVSRARWSQKFHTRECRWAEYRQSKQRELVTAGV